VTVEELREMARRLLERDCAEQGIEPVCADPALLVEVAALLRPMPHSPAPEAGRPMTPADHRALRVARARLGYVPGSLPHLAMYVMTEREIARRGTQRLAGNDHKRERKRGEAGD
jgi:hypothetical protein